LSALPLLLFAKLPEPGKVKTRLARGIGAEAAAMLAAAFLADAARLLGGLAGTAPVLCADPDPDADFFRQHFPSPWRRQAQGPGDLGERLERAIAGELARSPRAAAFGSDHPLLPPSELAPFLAEENAIWPTDDGGYAALVVSRRPGWETLFAGIPWSTPQVLAATGERARLAGIPLRAYPVTFDIDVAEDLPRLEVEIEGLASDAPAYPRSTAEALARLRSERAAR
jgi:glycosyltransferase A (GT-A) superfamily protein (DUF2064 family)